MATRKKRAQTPTLNQRRALAYLRLSPGLRKTSHAGDNTDAAGREVQIQDIRRWANLENIEIVREPFEDIDVHGDASNIDTPLSDRPGLLGAIAALRELDCGILIVQKGDRLARDTMLAPLVRRLVEREGARVVYANGIGNDNSPEAMIFRAFDDMLSAFELIRIRQRTTAALAIKKQRGERTGNIPYGWQLKSDGQHRSFADREQLVQHRLACRGCLHLEPNPTEQAAIDRVREIRDTYDVWSLRAIVKVLNEEKRPCRGKKWYPSSVATILVRLGSA